MSDTPLTDALIRKVYKDCEHYVHVLYVHGCTMEQELAKAILVSLDALNEKREAKREAAVLRERLQELREWMREIDCRDHPEAPNWFYSDGVPR